MGILPPEFRISRSGIVTTLRSPLRSTPSSTQPFVTARLSSASLSQLNICFQQEEEQKPLPPILLQNEVKTHKPSQPSPSKHAKPNSKKQVSGTISALATSSATLAISPSTTILLTPPSEVVISFQIPLSHLAYQTRYTPLKSSLLLIAHHYAPSPNLNSIPKHNTVRPGSSLQATLSSHTLLPLSFPFLPPHPSPSRPLFTTTTSCHKGPIHSLKYLSYRLFLRQTYLSH